MSERKRERMFGHEKKSVRKRVAFKKDRKSECYKNLR